MASVPINLALILATWTVDAQPAYRIEIAPAQRIEATLTFEVRTPNLTATQWEVFAASLPELPGQSKVSSKLEPGGKEIKEGSPLHRAILTARIKGETQELKKGIKLQVKYEGLLKSRRLILSQGTTNDSSVRPLSSEERQAALGRSAQYDFHAEAFQNWLKTHSLRRRNNEDTIAFGRRVFQVITDNFGYRYDREMDREASKVCRSEGSDCGGLSILFVSVLRANGVPARILAGRWVKSADKGEKLGGVPYLQTHVKAEFWADRVGWIPVDVSLAIKRKTNKPWFFGRDDGDFLVFHVDPDLVFATSSFGKKTMPFLQGIYYWVTGSGSLADQSTHEDWHVRKPVGKSSVTR